MATTPLSPDEFGATFRNFKKSAFRLEALDEYRVREEAEEFEHFLAGEAPRESEPQQNWCDMVRAARAAGKTMTRLRVMTVPLTPYLRFEIQWGYAYSTTAGEDIRMLPRHQATALGIGDIKDFWLFDDEVLIRMTYDSEGHFIEAVRDENPQERARLKSVTDKLLPHAVPLTEYVRHL